MAAEYKRIRSCEYIAAIQTEDQREQKLDKRGQHLPGHLEREKRKRNQKHQSWLLQDRYNKQRLELSPSRYDYETCQPKHYGKAN